ncbi:MAG: TIGR03960 family B12-binding radical SAM protein [Christensenellales bacterium]
MCELEQKLEMILPLVEKPSRYTGNELNICRKADASVRYLFLFPDVYEVGMSHLGGKILYEVINADTDTAGERAFAPWPDMEEKMREQGIPLFSLETKTPAAAFDFLGFTLQYEMSYTNVLNMLDLAGLPLRAADRGEDAPIVMVGGPCAFNAEPIAPFVDMVALGDGEESMGEVLALYRECRAKGQGKEAFLRRACAIEGIYVPGFYQPRYDQDGVYQGTFPTRSYAPATVQKRILWDLREWALSKPIVPYLSVVHDRIMLEVFRGCTRGCRFCQAGYIYRPVRERTALDLLETAKELVEATGYEEMSLSSLSTGDYSQLIELLPLLTQTFEQQRVALSLPSLRVDSFVKEYAREVGKVKRTGLTFAPEAGTQRLRDVINKGVTEQDLLRTVSDAFAGGYNVVKLYFMIGLPTETDEDLDGIADLVRKVGDCYYQIPKQQRARGLTVTVSVSSFVPKPHTPFQWCAQDSMQELLRKQRYLKSILNMRYVKYQWHDSKLSFLEGVFARGGRELAEVLEAAHALGCRFDGWQEHFDYERWMQAFEQAGLSPQEKTGAFALTDPLPWAHLSAQIEQDYFRREYERAIRAQTTRDCREGCNNCGIAGCSGVVVCG